MPVIPNTVTPPFCGMVDASHINPSEVTVVYWAGIEEFPIDRPAVASTSIVEISTSVELDFTFL